MQHLSIERICETKNTVMDNLVSRPVLKNQPWSLMIPWAIFIDFDLSVVNNQINLSNHINFFVMADLQDKHNTE